MAEPDVNYYPFCQLLGGSGVDLVGSVSSFSTTSFNVGEVAGTASATGGGTMWCLVVHN